MTRLACVPLRPRIGDLAYNVRVIETNIGAAVAAGADIVVLPELASSGYMFASQEEAASCAITADDGAVSQWIAAAGSATVVVGICETSADGRLYNSALVIDSSGVQGIYRKSHLWNQEKAFFAAGNDLPLLVDTPHGRIAVMICYDLEFPELTRWAALEGAVLIAAPVNWPLVPRAAGEHAPEQIMAKATARVNGVFVACTDRTGSERGQDWTEGTVIVGPDGWTIGSRAHDFVVVDAELSAASNKRLAEAADLFADRRVDLYTSPKSQSSATSVNDA
ncbi:nitrilase-related carbon-nitrogen hydrolase [Gordonia otitidis]|uniref:Hydrolase n=1 Tax=Gordonia otitidis (strain DSM 44809 / CCUG 52243 / JCM 12355 / NBRC 100426 / IFM 10032) TaxID=1108044 RepID=H5TU64_GORO1|nr:nitrilase-related carbon-nitrogen hydrolase [Gordonia otitidis]GAB37022.1 putative hydrolase [Gordonia otitidis NBRC 100426]